MKVFTAEQMRAFDKAATQEYSIPSIVLMENAALRVVEFLEMKFAPLRDKRIVVLCGKGNNGGDGFAIARHLVNAGCDLTVVAAATLEEMQGDARLSREMYTAARDPMGYNDEWPEEIITELTGNGSVYGKGSSDDTLRALPFFTYDILIDALLGTGFNGNVHDARIAQGLQLLQELPEIEHITWSAGLKQRIKVAVDIPSGLNADTGEATFNVKSGGGGDARQQRRDVEVSRTKEGYAKFPSFNRPRVDYTVTFVGPKRGMFVRDGLKACGEIWVGDIGTRSQHEGVPSTKCNCISREIRFIMRLRPLDSHKGDAGRVLVIGGSYGMSGAPTLAAKSILKVGAGLCIACLPDRVLPIFAAAFSEATSHPLPCDEDGTLIESAADELPKLWENVNAVALGPGLSRSECALNFARRVVRECPQPLIIDADALYALRAIADEVKNREAPTILTPHPGEMGELMEKSTLDVQNDRIETAIGCAKKYNAIVVLKGARSIVAFPDGDTRINLTGNSGMATGGAGDVLTGTIAGLLAQMKDARTATLLGVYLHGLAGDIEYSRKGNGLIAGDIVDALPEAMLELQKPEPEYSNARLRQLR